MEGAGERRAVVLLAPTEHGTAVAAGVDQGVQLAGLVPGDHDGLTAHVGREVVVVVQQLAFVCQIDPVAFEDVLHLEFEDLRIGECFATAPEDPLLGIFLHGGIDFRLDLIQCDRHSSSPSRGLILTKIVAPAIPRLMAAITAHRGRAARRCGDRNDRRGPDCCGAGRSRCPSAAGRTDSVPRSTRLRAGGTPRLGEICCRRRSPHHSTTCRPSISARLRCRPCRRPHGPARWRRAIWASPAAIVDQVPGQT